MKIYRLFFFCLLVSYSPLIFAKEANNYVGSYLNFSQDGLIDYGMNGELALSIGGAVLFDVVFSEYSVFNREVDTRGVSIGLTTSPLKEQNFSIAYSYWGRNRNIETESVMLAYTKWLGRWGVDIRSSYRNIGLYIPRIVSSTLVFLEFDIQNYGLGMNLKRLGNRWSHVLSLNGFYYSEDMTRLDVNQLNLPPLRQTTKLQRAALFSAISSFTLGGTFEDYNVSYYVAYSKKNLSPGLEISRSRGAIDKRIANMITPKLFYKFAKRHQVSLEWARDLSDADLWFTRVSYSIEF